MRWAEIIVEHQPEAAESVSDILIESGCGGTAENASGRQIRTFGYLTVDDRLESRLQAIRDRIAQLPHFGLATDTPQITVKWVEDDDWATAWKQFFKPLRIGRIVVKPTWEEFEPQVGDVVVELDPGMAFGTGNHPTTKLCLEILQNIIRGGEMVIDAGTGSGILAIAAAELGARRVIAFDNDPVAVRIARENVDRLGLGDIIKVEEANSPIELGLVGEIVVANIIATVIVGMAGKLAASVRNGGKLIASGIVSERANEVCDALTRHGMQEIERRVDGEWVALVMGRVS